MGIADREIIRLAGKDCFNKKPDYMGGGQGPATADEFDAWATNPKNCPEDYSLSLLPGDVKRELKIKQFRNRLTVPMMEGPDGVKVPSGEMPMLVVYENCVDFIRTIPALCLEDMTGEDLDKKQEDHIYDEACHICMARPIGGDIHEYEREAKKAETRKKVQAMDPDSRMAAMDFAKVIHQLAEEQEVEYEDNFLLDPEVYADDIFLN
jgi:hypothetical protein